MDKNQVKTIFTKAHCQMQAVFAQEGTSYRIAQRILIILDKSENEILLNSK